MQATEPLCYAHPYRQHLDATVTGIVKRDKDYGITVDRTMFYPEGGGQPGDRGRLGSLEVHDTQSDDQGRILHVVSDPGRLSVGMHVDLELDWTYRYHFMQQHTAQHLLSGLLHRILGIGTVSVHLGQEELSIELDVDELADEDVRRIEDAVNAVVSESVPVTTETVTQEQANSLGLRRPVKVDTDVRIVRIGTYDTIACGGVHVQHARELRYVQFLRSERIRGHVRTCWVAGDRSIELIRRNRRIVENAGTALSVPAREIVDGIATLQSQLADCRYHAHGANVRIASLLLHGKLDIQRSGNGVPIALFDASSWSEDEFKALPEALLPLDSLMLCVLRERADGKLAWLVSIKGVDGSHQLYQQLVAEALPAIGGKGGGRPPLWQGIATNPSGTDGFFAKVESLFTRCCGG